MTYRPGPCLRWLLLSALLALGGCDNTESTCESCIESDGGNTNVGDGGQSDAGFGIDGGPGADASLPCEVDCALEVVVDVDWLVSHRAEVQVLDVRNVASYEGGRIPGALRVDSSALRATVDGIGGQVAPQTALEAAFGAAGLERGRPVVVYGTQTDTTSARLLWTLEYAGHVGVGLLDGGYRAWSAAAAARSEVEVETGAGSAPATDYRIASIIAERRVDADWVRDRIADSLAVFVDARSDGEYAGGHIATALSVDWVRNIDSGSGMLLDRTTLDGLYPGLDRSGVPAVSYCQSGSRASVSYLVLRHLGFADVRLYDGSWAEWSALDSASYPRE